MSFSAVAKWFSIKLKQVVAIVLTAVTVGVALTALTIIAGLGGVVVAALYLGAAVFMFWLIIWASIQNCVALVARLNDGTPFKDAFRTARVQTSASVHTLRPRGI